ncbi:MAG TPA: ABC transporter permease subunit [Paraburkholderia sp.]|jgi:NitT/TauT family transport system permease protein|nr:ABC transporter permease subunit [Paraburkholderia sp.]
MAPPKSLSEPTPPTQFDVSTYEFSEQIGHLLRRAYQRHLAIFAQTIDDPQLAAVQCAGDARERRAEPDRSPVPGTPAALNARIRGEAMMRKFADPLLVALVIVVCWQCLHWAVGNHALSSPWSTVQTLVQMLDTSAFWENAGETARALVYALAIALAGGVLLGVLLGVNRLSGVVAEPILLNLYSLPKVTLYPLVLLVFGLGLSAKVAFGVMHGLIPILMFTMNAIRQMRPVYLRASKTMRLSFPRTVVHIVLPAILPEIVSGLRLGFSLTLLGVLIGEMFASQRGLGYLLTSAMNLGDIRTIMAVALFLTVVALSCNGLLMMADRRLKHR